MKKLLAQIIKFGAVGFLCFFIDYFIMVGLRTDRTGGDSVADFQRLFLHDLDNCKLYFKHYRGV